MLMFLHFMDCFLIKEQVYDVPYVGSCDPVSNVND